MVDNKAKDEKGEEAREMDMKGLFFFFSEFCFHSFQICCYRGMVVVGMPSRKGLRRTLVLAFEWDSFGADAKSAGEVNLGQVRWRRPSTDRLECLEDLLPVAMTVGVISA